MKKENPNLVWTKFRFVFFSFSAVSPRSRYNVSQKKISQKTRWSLVKDMLESSFDYHNYNDCFISLQGSVLKKTWLQMFT